MTERGGARRSRRHIWAGSTAIAGATTISALMLLAPAGLGAFPTTTTLVPPFKGASSQSFTYLDTQCGTAGGTVAHWNASTGVARGSAFGKDHFCSGPFGGQDGDITYLDIATIPFKVANKGFYNVSTVFSWRGVSAISLSTGTCPSAVNYSSGYDNESCYWVAGWGVSVNVTLWDLTNNSPVGVGFSDTDLQNYTEVYRFNTCTYGSCATMGGTLTGSSALDVSIQRPAEDYTLVNLAAGLRSAAGTIWSNTTGSNGNGTTNTTLLPSHHYAALVSLSFFAYADEGGYSSVFTGSTNWTYAYDLAGRGAASISALTPKEGLKISSLTIAGVG